MILSEQVLRLIYNKITELVDDATITNAYSYMAPDEAVYPFVVFTPIGIAPYSGFLQDYELVNVQFSVFDEEPQSLATIRIMNRLEELFHRKHFEFLDTDSGKHLICIYKTGESVRYLQTDHYWMGIIEFDFNCQKNINDAEGTSSSSSITESLSSSSTSELSSSSYSSRSESSKSSRSESSRSSLSSISSSNSSASTDSSSNSSRSSDSTPSSSNSSRSESSKSTQSESSRSSLSSPSSSNSSASTDSSSDSSRSSLSSISSSNSSNSTSSESLQSESSRSSLSTPSSSNSSASTPSSSNSSRSSQSTPSSSLSSRSESSKSSISESSRSTSSNSTSSESSVSESKSTSSEDYSDSSASTASESNSSRSESSKSSVSESSRSTSSSISSSNSSASTPSSSNSSRSSVSTDSSSDSSRSESSKSTASYSSDTSSDTSMVESRSSSSSSSSSSSYPQQYCEVLYTMEGCSEDTVNGAYVVAGSITSPDPYGTHPYYYNSESDLYCWFYYLAETYVITQVLGVYNVGFVWQKIDKTTSPPYELCPEGAYKDISSNPDGYMHIGEVSSSSNSSNSSDSSDSSDSSLSSEEYSESTDSSASTDTSLSSLFDCPERFSGDSFVDAPSNGIFAYQGYYGGAAYYAHDLGGNPRWVYYDSMGGYWYISSTDPNLGATQISRSVADSLPCPGDTEGVDYNTYPGGDPDGTLTTYGS